MSVEGMDKLNRRLKAIADNRALLRQVQLGTIAEAKRRVPRKTGFLGRSIQPGPISDTSAIVQATANYAAAVELGTRPHIIRPRTARVLAWPADASGRRLSGRARTGAAMRFATLVRHPGTRKQPFLVPGAEAAIKEFGADYIVKRWNDAA